MYKKRRIHISCLIGLLCLIQAFLLVSCSGNGDGRNAYKVLIVHSHRADRPWSEDLNNGVIDCFDDHNLPVAIEIFYLNNEQLSPALLADSLSQLLSGISRPDLILLSADHAINAFFNSGHPYTYTVPVVFHGANYIDKALFANHTNVTGFTTPPDYKRTYFLMKSLFPDMKGIAFDTDNTDLGQKALFDFQWQTQSLSQEIDVKVTNMDTSEGAKYLIDSNLPDKYTHIMPAWNSFYSGRVRKSRYPFFLVSHEGLGTGYIGGYVTLPYTQMYDAAKRGIEILKGRFVSDFEITPVTPAAVVDWKQLKRYDIQLDQIPEGVNLINVSFFERYYKHIVWGSILFVFLIICVSVLLVVLSRRAQKVKMKTQEELLGHRSRLKIVMSSIREGVISIDKNMTVFAINPAALKWLNLSDREGEYIRRSVLSLLDLSDPDKQGIKSMIESVFRNGDTIQFDERHMKSLLGEVEIPVSGAVSAIYLNGELYGAVIVFSNITEEFSQRAFLRLTLDAGGYTSWSYDQKKGRLVFGSSFVEKYNIKHDGSYGIALNDFRDMIYPDDVAGWDLVNKMLITGEVDRYVFNLRVNIDGSNYQWWEIRFTCLRSLDPNELPLIFGLCSNVEKSVNTLKTLEQARDKAQMSDKLKSAFLANMSHEIRTPLNAIVGFANLLTSDEDFEREERQVFIETIRNNCNLLLALISDVLDLAQIESGSMHYKEEVCNVNDLISQIVITQQVIIPDYLQLIKDVPDETIYILIDVLRLNQVITNLINNAVKFTKKGSVTVGYTFDNDGWVNFYVEDTGKGIPEKDLNTIFERFFKKDDFAQGAGLGLSICKMIVDHYDGNISVTSTEGVGSRFTVSIPYVPAFENDTIKKQNNQNIINNFASMNPTNVDQMQQDRVTLLIAEDEDSNYLLLKTVLQKQCNLIRAKTGIEALDLFKANKVDLIMLDIKMPEMTGIEALKEIRKLSADIPIIMQSAYVFDTDMEAVRQAGATDFITKPINLKILKSTISKFCPSVQW